VLRAYELWRKLERDTYTQLLHITGGMNIGSRDGELVNRTIAAAERHSIPFDVLDEREIGKRFPVVVPQTGDVAVSSTLRRKRVPAAPSFGLARLFQLPSAGPRLQV